MDVDLLLFHHVYHAPLPFEKWDPCSVPIDHVMKDVAFNILNLGYITNRFAMIAIYKVILVIIYKLIIHLLSFVVDINSKSPCGQHSINYYTYRSSNGQFTSKFTIFWVSCTNYSDVTLAPLSKTPYELFSNCSQQNISQV